MEFWRQVIQQLRQIWSSLSRPAQVGYALIATVSLAVVAGVGIWASRPEYRVLASDLDPQAAAELVAELDRQSVPYQITAGGTQIQVPVTQWNKARMDLAMAGVASGPKGFELFDQTTFGTTPFVEQLTYTRAMIGELQRVIEDLESVDKAKVMIARPEPTPFVREQKPVTASVVVWAKRSGSISSREVEGIIALLSGSLAGLVPENVSVLDHNGRALSQAKIESLSGLNSEQLRYQRELESYLASKAEQVLSRLVGPENAIVRVSAEINYENIAQTSELFGPDEGVVTTESKTTSDSSAPGTQGGQGSAGVGSALPQGGAPAPTGTAPPETTSEITSDSQYAVSKRSIQKMVPPGAIRRLTVAVLLLPREEFDPVTNERKKSATVPGDIITSAKELTAKALGADMNSVEVRAVPPKDPSPQVPRSWGEVMQEYLPWLEVARLALLGIALLAAFLVAWRTIRRIFGLVRPPVTPEVARLQAQIASQAATRPDAIAAILRQWLTES